MASEDLVSRLQGWARVCLEQDDHDSSDGEAELDQARSFWDAASEIEWLRMRVNVMEYELGSEQRKKLLDRETGATNDH